MLPIHPLLIGSFISKYLKTVISGFGKVDNRDSLFTTEMFRKDGSLVKKLKGNRNSLSSRKSRVLDPFGIRFANP